jgi:uncharacterized membrane protein
MAATSGNEIAMPSDARTPLNATAKADNAQRQDSTRGGLMSQLAAVGVGVTAMYFLDPERGRRRRNLLRDKLLHAAHETSDAIGTTGRDLSNRVGGIGAVARRRFQGDRGGDAVLVNRVRAELGRVVSKPGAIEVTSQQGLVTLEGPILASEAEDLLAHVGRVRGVEEVIDRLERHETPGDVPALQGDGQPSESTFELLQENWSPAARLVVGVTGAALTRVALRADERTDPRSAVLGLVGAGLVVRSVTNMPFERLIGRGAGRNAIAVQKSITIDAPIDEVFAWLVAWERWPHWMSHVRQVRALAGSGAVGERTHWVVDGPAGARVEWDAETTRFVPPVLVAWRTVEGGPVAHAGTIRLVPTSLVGTRLDLRMTYNPIAGAAGHIVAMLLQRDPKRQLDDDLARLKTTIETGRPPHDAAVNRGT